jgi:hypothetical protein
MLLRAIVISQSLEEPLPVHWSSWVSKEYTHSLSGFGNCDIREFEFNDAFKFEAVFELASRLLKSKFYAHILAGESMIVVFPNVICIVDVNKPNTAEVCRNVGRCFGIPDSQMAFEKMFYLDHPDKE